MPLLATQAHSAKDWNEILDNKSRRHLPAFNTHWRLITPGILEYSASSNRIGSPASFH